LKNVASSKMLTAWPQTCFLKIQTLRAIYVKTNLLCF